MKKINFFLTFNFLIFIGGIQAQKIKMNLMDCVEMAIEKNISIKQIELSGLDAEINKRDAKGNFFPSINAQANHSWNIGLNQDITRGTLENITTQYTSLGANLSLDIYNGLRNLNQLYRSNLSILASQFQLDDMKDDIRLMVLNAYLQIMFNIEFLNVQKSQLKVTKEDAERTKRMIDAGIRIKADLFEIEANLASQEQTVVIADNNLRLSKINLAQILLITDYENFDIVVMDMDVPFSQILIQSPKSIYENALNNRNDIKLLLTNIEIAEKDIDLAKGSLHPNLSAFYGFNSRVSYADRIIGDGIFNDIPIGFVSTTNDQVFRSIEGNETAGPLPFFEQFNLNKGHNLGLRLSVPIFNGNAVRNNLERTKVNLLRQQNQLEQEKLNLENTINEAYNSANGAYKLYEASKKTLKARKRAYEDSINRFEAGTINSFDFNLIKQRYDVASSDEVRAKFDYIFKLKVLEFYFGLQIKL